MTNQKILTLSLTTIFAFSASALAQEGEKKGGKKSKPNIERFDTDKDGVLSAEEKVAMKASQKKRRAKMITLFDADKDGSLNADEKKTAVMTTKKQNLEIKKASIVKFDTDGDGKLSEEESSGVQEWVKTQYPDSFYNPKARGGKKSKAKTAQ